MRPQPLTIGPSLIRSLTSIISHSTTSWSLFNDILSNQGNYGGTLTCSPPYKEALSSRPKMRKQMENLYWFPCSIFKLSILPLDQNLMDSALVKTTLLFVQNGLRLQPNGIKLIQFRNVGLNFMMDPSTFFKWDT